MTILKQEIKDLNWKEVWEALRDNYLYGFLSVSSMTFVKLGIDIGIILAVFIFYLFLSKVVNRPKYVTFLGKLQ